jgi:hypothetical protein
VSTPWRGGGRQVKADLGATAVRGRHTESSHSARGGWAVGARRPPARAALRGRGPSISPAEVRSQPTWAGHIAPSIHRSGQTGCQGSALCNVRPAPRPAPSHRPAGKRGRASHGRAGRSANGPSHPHSPLRRGPSAAIDARHPPQRPRTKPDHASSAEGRPQMGGSAAVRAGFLGVWRVEEEGGSAGAESDALRHTLSPARRGSDRARAPPTPRRRQDKHVRLQTREERYAPGWRSGRCERWWWEVCVGFFLQCEAGSSGLATGEERAPPRVDGGGR